MSRKWTKEQEAELRAALERVRELREILEHRDAQAERDSAATVRAMQEADARTMAARADRDHAFRAQAEAEARVEEYRERLESVRARRDVLDQQLRAGPAEGAAAYWKAVAGQAQTAAARLRDRVQRQRVQIRDLTARHVLTKKGFDTQARTIGRLTAELEQATDDLVDPRGEDRVQDALSVIAHELGWPITQALTANGIALAVRQRLSGGVPELTAPCACGHLYGQHATVGPCTVTDPALPEGRCLCPSFAARQQEKWRPGIPRRDAHPFLKGGQVLTVQWGPTLQEARYRIGGFIIDSEHGLTHLTLEHVPSP